MHNINYLGQILSDIGNLKLMEQDKFEGADINLDSLEFLGIMPPVAIDHPYLSCSLT
jgi:hypothetical protein